MERKIKYLLLLLTVAISLAACQKKMADTSAKGGTTKENPPPVRKPVKPHGYPGTIKDMSSLDGCKWMIELDKGGKIQPLNMADFNVVAVDGKRVLVDYTEAKGVMSTCMSGKVVKITGIWEL